MEHDVDYFENLQLRADAISKEDLLLARVRKLERFGGEFIRYSLVLILFWIGALKFGSYQAQAIEPYVAGSPLMSWGYSIMSVQRFSTLIGSVEILLGLLIAFRPFSRRACLVGSLFTVGLFLLNLSFLITTPGVIQEGHSFQALSRLVGQFVIKDTAFLGAAIWSAAEAWKSLLLDRRKMRSLNFGSPIIPNTTLLDDKLSA